MKSHLYKCSEQNLELCNSSINIDYYLDIGYANFNFVYTAPLLDISNNTNAK